MFTVFFDKYFKENELNGSNYKLTTPDLVQIFAHLEKNYPEVKSIQLSNCKIEAIPDILFSNDKSYENLVKLDLFDNVIKRIPINFFQSLKSLAHLDLSDNEITVLDTFMFQKLEALTYLKLSKNHITALDENIFESLTKLTTLILQGNEITSLQGQTFKNNINLLALDLSDNKIVTLEPELFSRFEALDDLDLSENRLLKIYKNLPKNIAVTLKFLNLSKIANMNIFCSDNESIFNLKDVWFERPYSEIDNLFLKIDVILRNMKKIWSGCDDADRKILRENLKNKDKNDLQKVVKFLEEMETQMDRTIL